MQTWRNSVHRKTQVLETHSRTDERGFSLIEAMVAMSVLLVGLLALAQLFCVALGHLKTSSAHLVAREKAREAIESVHMARDAKAIGWAQLRNATAPASCPASPVTPAGGAFLAGEQVLRKAGPDGLVNTTDDTGYEKSPGNDNVLGTADDKDILDFWRTIAICDVNDDLRRVQVTIRYKVGQLQRTYTLTTMVSSFS